MPLEKATEFGKRIREVSLRYFTAQKDFALALGVKETLVSQFYNTPRTPSLDTMKKVFRVLKAKGATPEELVFIVLG